MTIGVPQVPSFPQLPSSAKHISPSGRWIELLTWIVPPLVTPTLRYFQDPAQSRKQLYIRDMSTYSLGAALFLGLRVLLERVTHQPMVAFLGALAANQLYAGIGAVKLSQWVDKKILKPVSPVTSNPKDPMAPSFAVLRQRVVPPSQTSPFPHDGTTPSFAPRIPLSQGRFYGLQV